VQIENSFVVSVPPPRVWDLLLDVTKVAQCMPGAELTEVVDDRTWKGRVRLRLGPVSMNYSGTVIMTERDDAAYSVVLRAEGRETGGKGNAAATVRSRVEPTDDGGSRVQISQDLQLSGAAAQFGNRMIQDVSSRLTQQFADCLGAQLSAADASADAGPATEDSATATEAATTQGRAAAVTAPSEIPALRLALWAILRAIGRLLHLQKTAREGRQ
jgi:uncharacterized protein